jgi:hypothetical protein
VRLLEVRGLVVCPMAGAQSVREVRSQRTCWQRGRLQAMVDIVRRGIELGAGEQAAGEVAVMVAKVVRYGNTVSIVV